MEITKKFIKECVALYKKQYERDRKFEKSFSEYFTEASGVFGHTTNLDNLVEKLWMAYVEDCEVKECGSWLSWYVIECDFGKNKLSAFLSGKEYKIRNDNDFANFIIKWRKSFEHTKK